MDELWKNQIVTAVMDGWSADGAGVCHIGGRAVFVPRAIPGERWDVKILKVTSAAVYGLGVKLYDPAPDRAEPACPYFGRCGGCDTWHLSYEAELRFKLGRVNDALRHVGGQMFHVEHILGCENPLNYRNKGIYAVTNVNNRAAAGFYRAGAMSATSPLRGRRARRADWADSGSLWRQGVQSTNGLIERSTTSAADPGLKRIELIGGS